MMARSSTWNSTRKLALSTRCGVYLRGGGRCAWCEVPVTKDHLHIDHVQPRAAGGASKPDNLVPACSECNWRREHGELTGRQRALGLKPSTVLQRVRRQIARPVDRAAGRALAECWYPWHRRRLETQAAAQRRLKLARREAAGDTSFNFGAEAA